MRANTTMQLQRLFWSPLLVLLLWASYGNAQPISQGNLADIRTTVNTDGSLSDESRTDLLARLDAASSQLQVEKEHRDKAAEFQSVIDNAERRASEFEQQLASAKENPPDHSKLLPQDANRKQIEGQITLVTAERQALSDRRSQILQEIDNQAARRTEIQQRLVELQSAAQPTPPRDQLDRTAEEEVSYALAQARHQANEAEKRSLEIEVLSEPARSQVGAAERAWLGYAIEQAESKLNVLNAALELARKSATQERLESSDQLAEKLQSEDPALQKYARRNRALVERLEQIASETDSARAEGLQIQTLLEGIEQDTLLMNRRLQVAGHKEILGRVMITRLDSLPETSRIRKAISNRNQLIADTSLDQIDVEEDFRALNERKNYLSTLVPDLDLKEESSRALVTTLVEQRAKLLEDNLQSLGSLLGILLDNNDKSQELIVATDEFHQFLLGNLLWVQNFSFVDPRVFAEQLAVLAGPQQWSALPAQLVSGFNRANWSTPLLLVLLISLLLRRQLAPVYERLMSKPILLSDANLGYVAAGLALSALLVAPWPLLVYLLGHFLQASSPGSEFTDAMAPALTNTARILYFLLFTRITTSRTGVGRRFLKWDTRSLDALRKELNWAGPTLCLAYLVSIFAFHLDVVASGGPLGAISTAVMAYTIILFCYRLLKVESIAEDSMSKLSLRVAMIVGIVVIVMQMVGLLFAAEIYLLALGRSAAVLLVIKTIGDSLERWLLIMRARLERKAREDLRAQESEDEESPEEVEDLVDVLSLSEAHAKLLNMGRFIAIVMALFVIWSPTLPAFNLLEGVTLWSVSDSTNPGVPRAITLFDLIWSGVILMITALVTRHLPSLAEVFMREWFNMSAGARYASSILMQYLVIAIGGSMFLTTIGWEWGKVQWLVAAMGVGIGFGLQEIVANFISGIIILFERPVRVGDIISAGGAEGVVKKINPRATVIETFERKEHLIPNKELITGQVINWSLTENAVRIIIPVGVAYGSDVRQAMSLMLEAASEVELVLDEPTPSATFEDFGDNALLLWLRCYVSEQRPTAWTELRTLINDKFNDAGLVIAFPQRDIHLDTIEPLRVEISGGEVK